MKIALPCRGLFLIGFLGIFCTSLPASAFNPESAELTYHADTTNNSSLRYFFKLAYYTSKTLTVPTVLPTAQIKFSDGSPIIQVERANRALLSTNALLYREVYYFEHRFPVPGTFNVTFSEINRKIDYVNIPNSENIAFLIRATVRVGLETAGNRSPQFLAPPIKLGILGQPYRQNVTAYDPDGDSLAFKLVPAMQYLNQYIPAYVFPEGATINNRTGEFIWPSPNKAGRYSVVVEVREYRHGRLMGIVMRELSLNIGTNEQYPSLEIRNRDQVPVNVRNQVFVAGNTPVKIRVAATNASNLIPYSELFRLGNVASYQTVTDNPREIELTIIPNNALRRSLPYIITFRGNAPTANPEIFHQQDLTVAVYFRPERVTDQQNTTEPGALPALELEPDSNESPNPDTLGFKFYPNPVRTWFLVLNPTNQPVTLQVYNSQYQQVISRMLTEQETVIQRGKEIKAGIYLYVLLTETGELLQAGKLVFQ